MDKIKVTQWRKKPVVIEAYQFENKAMTPDNRPNWLMDAVKAGTVHFHGGKDEHLTIKTLEGEMRANIGDWIIKGVQGELYPCKPDIFAKTYEPALATRTDATPVAWMPMTSSPMDDQILAAIKVRHRDGHPWWERHIIVIDSETGTISDMDFHHGWEAEDYECWQPLPAAPDATNTHPPATDVAALVEAADWALAEIEGRTRYTPNCMYEAKEQRENALDKFRQALAPFTKGQP